MKDFVKILLCSFIISQFVFQCKSQDKENNPSNQDRESFVAGKFYESDSQKLRTDIESFYRQAKPSKSENVIAIISPHAGYIFSGKVAASAFMQINPNLDYDCIFILAPSHYFAFEGASVWNQGSFITPLGKVEVDSKIADELIKDNSVFKYIPEAHNKEHAIEVQLPFLQVRMKKKFKIVPVIIGTQDQHTIEKIAQSLKNYLKPGNLFIISSDFSHYPSYDDANKIDNASALAILKNSPEELINYIQKSSKSNTQGLATCMCGEAGILCLLNMSSKIKNVEYHLIDYMNSGGTEYGDKKRVVGYWAISLVKKTESVNPVTGFKLSEDDKEKLLMIARNTLEEYIKKDIIINPDTTKISTNLKTNCGAFVTLTSNGNLRGCIGSFAIDEPVYKVVRDMSVSASSNDPRFDKVKPAELKNIEIEISVLTPMHKIDSISQIEIGKHGIYIKNGYRRGTLLPQVATGNNWTKEQFVKYCAVYKAGIPEDEIKNSELYVYEAIVFKEHDKQ